MKYTLLPYQETAAHEVMDRLYEARKAHGNDQQAIFSLSAPTGSGKTVITTSVFERLLLPSDDYDPDRNAVIIWLSDNPDLNKQSRYRVETASSDLAQRTVEIDATFNLPMLERGKIYFLNTQKLGKGTKLTGGTDAAGTSEGTQYTFWDTLRNTITSPDRTLYLIVDEAHRGAASQSRDKKTILRTLIEGHTPRGGAPVPPMPIVMGISATPMKFKKMVQDMHGTRLVMDDVTVPITDVQESGLIKDIVELIIPGEEGKSFDNVFVRKAARVLHDVTRRWSDYCDTQAGERVTPLMVVQMRDKCTRDDIAQAIRSIREGWPDIDPGCFANVFGEHADITAGGVDVPYVEPQTVQDRDKIRVLFAKSAISTGWDCPRAEVMVSYRPARDVSHITQVIGRMVRSPLARRIDGNDQLNAVLCILPFFDRGAAEEVAQKINADTDTEGSQVSTETVIEPVTLYPADLPEVWDVFETLPRMIAPTKKSNPISLLINVYWELNRDEILDGGSKEAIDKLVSFIDGYAAQYDAEVNTAKEEILKVETERLVFNYADRTLQDEDDTVTLFADQRVIEEAYASAIPVFTAEVADAWVHHYVTARASDDADEDELLDNARLTLAALSQVDGMYDRVRKDANEKAAEVLSKTRADVKTLSDTRRARYEQLQSMSMEPEFVTLTRPINRIVKKSGFKDDKQVDFPRYDMHLLVEDGSSTAPFNLNEWERKVVEAETARKGAVAWYRNPSHAGAEAVTMTYFDKHAGRWRCMQPDFVFFRDTGAGVRPSIVDPHSGHLGDSLMKLRALAEYAERFGDVYDRVEAVAGDTVDALRVLDVTRADVREALRDDKAAAKSVFDEFGEPYV